MAQSAPQDNEAIHSFLEKAGGILAAFDFDNFPEVFSKDVEYRSGPHVQHGLEAFISHLKGQLANVPPISMKHVKERTDIMDDGLIYAIGTSTMTFNSHPDEPGQPEAGKIASLTLYEDPTSMIMKVQEIMGGQK